MERSFGGTSDGSNGNPLLPNWIERYRRDRRDDKHFTAVLLDTMFLQWARLSAELLLGKRNCETNAARRNFTFGESFDSTESDEIAEAVEPFTPASARSNELQPLPVAKRQTAPKCALLLCACSVGPARLPRV
jgi:hypothetical protein